MGGVCGSGEGRARRVGIKGGGRGESNGIKGGGGERSGNREMRCHV